MLMFKRTQSLVVLAALLVNQSPVADAAPGGLSQTWARQRQVRYAATKRSDGRCGPNFLAPNGRMVECNQFNNGNCCMVTEYCGGWNCNSEWNYIYDVRSSSERNTVGSQAVVGDFRNFKQ